MVAITQRPIDRVGLLVARLAAEEDRPNPLEGIKGASTASGDEIPTRMLRAGLSRLISVVTRGQVRARKAYRRR
jgi:hypothetical protein